MLPLVRREIAQRKTTKRLRDEWSDKDATGKERQLWAAAPALQLQHAAPIMPAQIAAVADQLHTLEATMRSQFALLHHKVRAATAAREGRATHMRGPAAARRCGPRGVPGAVPLALYHCAMSSPPCIHACAP